MVSMRGLAAMARVGGGHDGGEMAGGVHVSGWHARAVSACRVRTRTTPSTSWHVVLAPLWSCSWRPRRGEP